MRKRINNLFFLVGMVAVFIMCCTFEVSFPQLWRDLTRAGWWLVPILLLWLPLYMLNALAWKVIIRSGGSCPAGFSRLLRFTVTGFALNYVTPSGLLGGEAYKIMTLSRFIGVERATSSVVLFSMMHIFSHFWFWLTAVAVYLVLAAAGILPMNGLLAVLLSLTVLFCCGGIYLFIRGYKYGLVGRLVRFVSRIPGVRSWGRRFEEKHRESLQKIDRQIAELQNQNRKAFYTSLFLEYAGRLLQSFEIFFMLILLDADGCREGYAVTFLYSFLALAFTSLFANLLGFMPMQIGGREGGFAMSAAQLGMSAETGLFIGIICRVRELFWIMAGLLLIKMERRRDGKGNNL